MNKNFARKKYSVVIFGKAKVSEFDKYNNFDPFFFKQKKATQLGGFAFRRLVSSLSSVLFD
jgi:hypothetical protein